MKTIEKRIEFFAVLNQAIAESSVGASNSKKRLGWTTTTPSVSKVPQPAAQRPGARRWVARTAPVTPGSAATGLGCDATLSRQALSRTLPRAGTVRFGMGGESLHKRCPALSEVGERV